MNSKAFVNLVHQKQQENNANLVQQGINAGIELANKDKESKEDKINKQKERNIASFKQGVISSLSGVK